MDVKSSKVKGWLKVPYMITVIRFILTLLIIILITPQTNTENILLRAFNDSNMFINYREAKSFLQWLTWVSVGLYLFITYLAIYWDISEPS